MAWECSSLVNPTAGFLLPRGLSGSGGCRSRWSFASRTARPPVDAADVATAARSRGGRRRRRHMVVSVRLDDSADGGQQQQALNFSVLRFTLGEYLPAISPELPWSQFGALMRLIQSILMVVVAGIPGLDESYLPRYIGLAFGSLIVLNHLLGSSDSPTPAQLVCSTIQPPLVPFLSKELIKNTS